MSTLKINSAVLCLSLISLVGCDDVDDPHAHHHHDHELITAVVLDFNSADEQLSFKWSDDHSEGVTIDDVVLSSDQTYDLSVSFLNEEEDPVEDVTLEIEDEADEHQVFFTGEGVFGPSTGDNPNALIEQSYSDQDSNGSPLGLENEVLTLTQGTSELIVTLRHMPFESGNSIKSSDEAGKVASGGFEAIGGANDVQVTFSLTVE
ncbi:MAG: hypothetical protein CMK59_08010 [Proteobacteria bacterium]|nr:hypothetical protein [Pseudomonadota bacterium]